MPSSKRRWNVNSTATMVLFGASLLFSTSLAEVRIQKKDFRGWPGSYWLTNGSLELVVTSDVGPRIIHVGFVDGENLVKVFADQAGKTGGDQWRIYGGHRLWHSPEDKVRTYEPDNHPVRVDELPNGVRLIQEVEPGTRIRRLPPIWVSLK